MPQRRKARTTQRYELRDNRKLVYVGITDDLDRRVEEHTAGGKRFTSVNLVGPKVTEESAKAWEQKRIDTYRENHGNRNPRHNKQ